VGLGVFDGGFCKPPIVGVGVFVAAFVGALVSEGEAVPSVGDISEVGLNVSVGMGVFVAVLTTPGVGEVIDAFLEEPTFTK